jgi:hypothetical protein
LLNCASHGRLAGEIVDALLREPRFRACRRRFAAGLGETRVGGVAGGAIGVEARAGIEAACLQLRAAP